MDSENHYHSRFQSILVAHQIAVSGNDISFQKHQDLQMFAFKLNKREEFSPARCCGSR